MKNLSGDIQTALDSMLDLLGQNIDLDGLDVANLKNVMLSKTDTFKYAKKMLNQWQQSPNAPQDSVIREYVKMLVDAGDQSIGILRQALRTKTKKNIKDFAQTKVLILESIWELDATLVELRLQLDSDDINLQEREFRIGYAEKFSKGEFFPESNYHQKWYNESEDAIMICPNGTKGEVINIDGLKIQLPKKPPRKEILFSNLSKKEQYWRRTPLPKGLNVNNSEPFIDYIMEEFRRRREGVWFMNNGEAVYLTGNAYFALQWCKMRDTGDYMNFRYAQLEMFYFKEACLRDKRCVGELFVKSRRTGFTYVTLAMMLNEATSSSNNNYGMTSQSDADAKKAWLKLVYMFLNLPFFFQPVVKGTVDSPKVLEFAKPSDRSKKFKKAKDTNTDEYLNNMFDYQPTKDGSYDGQALRQYLGDESGKWKKPANYIRHWGRISPTMNQTGRIVGKAWIGSTVNPMSEGGEEFRKMYDMSQMSKRDKVTGRTPSGLYAHFLPAHKNMEEFTDVYGVCHEEKPEKTTYNVYGEEIKMGSIDFLKAQRKLKRAEGDIAYNEELRANPMTVAEAFRDSATHVVFNLEKIMEQYEYNNSEIRLGQVVHVGDFAWKGGVFGSEVIWIPSALGKFKVTWFPPENMRNRFTTKLGVKYPVNSFGGFGCDPYDISGVVQGKGSNGALSGVTNDGGGIAPPHQFFLEYCTRVEAEVFFEDVLMAMIFYSLPNLIENNKSRILYYIRDRGYRGFSMNRPDKPFNKLSVAEREVGGMPSSSEDTKQMHAQAIQYYIDKYVGIERGETPEKRVREYGEMGQMYFQKTLNDWLQFDYAKRTKSDLTISSGYALMNVNKHLFRPEKKIETINFGMAKYDTSGVISEIIR